MDIAVARGAIHANPVAVRPEDGEGRLKKKRTPKKLTLPSMANTHRLFVAIENSGNLGGWSIEIADFCRFLFFSGCRIGETPAVTWSCVDWSKKQLHVKGSKTATSDRIVPLFAETEALLKRVVERRKGMGVGVADRIFRVSECQKSIDRACKAPVRDTLHRVWRGHSNRQPMARTQRRRGARHENLRSLAPRAQRDDGRESHVLAVLDKLPQK
jgi:integrase